MSLSSEKQGNGSIEKSGSASEKLLDVKLCGKLSFEAPVRNPKGRLVKEQALCANLGKKSLQIEGKSKIKNDASVLGQRSCLPINGKGYVKIEPSTQNSKDGLKKAPLDADNSIAMNFAVDTPLWGGSSVVATFEMTVSGEFKSFEVGLEWGCKGSSVSAEISGSGGLNVEVPLYGGKKSVVP